MWCNHVTKICSDFHRPLHSLIYNFYIFLNYYIFTFYHFYIFLHVNTCWRFLPVAL